jgi:hypothetical protein
MTSSRSIVSASSVARLAVWLVLAAVLVAWPAEAAARKRVAVLPFAGPKAEKFQADFEKVVKRRHSVVAAAKWDQTADKLGATDVTDRDLKKVATALNVDAVIVGEVEKRGAKYYLHLELRAGATGKVLHRPDIISRAARLDAEALDDVEAMVLPLLDKLRAAGDEGDDEENADDDDDDRGRAKPRGKANDDDRGRAKPRGEDEDEDDDEDRDDRDRAKPRGKPADDRGRAKPRDDDRDDRDDDDRDDDDRGRAKPRDDDRDDDDRDDRDDDDDRVSFRDDDRDDDDRDDDDRDDDDRDDDDRDDDRDGDRDAAPTGFAAVDLAAGLSFTGRTLAFTTNLTENAPQGYRGAPVPGIRVAAEVFPLALNRKNRSVTKNLGVTALFDRVVAISSEVRSTTMTYKLDTTEQHLAVGLVYRHPLSAALALEGSVRWNKRTFAIDKGAAPADAVDIPNTDYSYVDPGVGLTYALGGKAALGADARFLLITDTGEMQAVDQYGASTVTGVDVSASFDYRVAAKMVVRATAGFATIGYAFKGNGALTNNRDNDPTDIDVSGARDTYFGGSLGAAYQF